MIEQTVQKPDTVVQYQPNPSKRSMNQAQKRIHEAAMALFAKHGVTTVTISELAEEAGVARGTIYNNIESLDNLFRDICSTLASEMNNTVVEMNEGIENPVERLARGIKMYMKRTHEEPVWGRFIVTFALSQKTMRDMWSGPPILDVLAGMEQDKYGIDEDKLPMAMAMIAGTTCCAMLLVLEGMKTWRDAAKDGVELVLRGLGVKEKEIRKVAMIEV
jgi:AcrR family transcriptional regulator